MRAVLDWTVALAGPSAYGSVRARLTWVALVPFVTLRPSGTHRTGLTLRSRFTSPVSAKNSTLSSDGIVLPPVSATPNRPIQRIWSV